MKPGVLLVVEYVIREYSGYMSTINPRYPHWCQIYRKVTDSPMDDELETPTGQQTTNDDPLVDEGDYDPMGVMDEEPLNANESNQNEETVAEDSETEEESDEGAQNILIYEGECRSYKVNTTSDKGEVITSQRGLALPLNRDAWDALGVIPMEGDKVYVRQGQYHEEYGNIIDKSIATAEFAGTHVIWKFVRN